MTSSWGSLEVLFEMVLISINFLVLKGAAVPWTALGAEIACTKWKPSDAYASVKKTITGLANSLSPVEHEAIIWTNAGLCTDAVVKYGFTDAMQPSWHPGDLLNLTIIHACVVYVPWDEYLTEGKSPVSTKDQWAAWIFPFCC